LADDRIRGLLGTLLLEVTDATNIGQENFNKGLHRGLSVLFTNIEEVKKLIQQKDK
jgi:hypothetical protein